MSFEVQPWPAYSEDGMHLFWEIRVVSARFVGWVGWATHLGRFVESNEMSRLRTCNARLAHALADFMADFNRQPGQSKRDKNRPKRDKEAGQNTGTDGTASRAQESLRLETSLSRSGHNDPGRDKEPGQIGVGSSDGIACRRPVGQHCAAIARVRCLP